ncbi:MAG: protein kinase [Gammaproteobacteria bacterium]|jgi:eukaryotic-like serine/threonine-protein kinase|nr:protein kinase [Gammaproteobacteria bacterium]
MQLPDYFFDVINSVKEEELQLWLSRFSNGEEQVDLVEFARYLYLKDVITADELKKMSNQERIDLNLLDGDDEIAGENEDKSSKETYTILESIDEGAMGEILIAKDNELGRSVAYKRIHSHVAEHPGFLKRFFMEAKITAQLQHPNIVPVYGLKTSDDEIGYAMKLIQGKTLNDLIVEAREQIDQNNRTDEYHSQAALLDHFLKVCDALHYAHRKGVVHRDLKPLNIMVGPYNEVYVMDWGISKLVEVDKNTFEDKTERVDSEIDKQEEDKTTIGELLGTPVYMSPEQAKGENNILDHRSDIFSLALILFELITLKRALAGKSQIETIERASSATLNPPVPYSHKIHVPKQLIAVINKATKLNPNERYATVKEFANDIRRYIRGEAVTARPDNLKHKIIRWMNRHRAATFNIVSYLILASIFITGWSFYQQQNAKINAQTERQRMGQFISSVSKQAQAIDSKFLKYEGIVQGVAASAITLLEGKQKDVTRFYDYKDFADPQLAPPDLAESLVYGFPISVGWHAYKLSPGVEYSQAEELVRILNPLRHTFKRMILRSHHSHVAADDHVTAMRVIKDQGLPLVWTYVGLEEGVFAEYPGKTGYPEDFDARKRPWYVNTLTKEGSSCWMPPYVDVGGRGVLLPCTSKLFNSEGKFLGVAAVEMTIDYIRHELMSISDLKGIETTYLLNERAAIIADSSKTVKSYERGTLINSIDNLEIFPKEVVVDNIKMKESGYINFSENGRDKILAYVRLNSIGWYYLAVADAMTIESTSEVKTK